MPQPAADRVVAGGQPVLQRDARAGVPRLRGDGTGR